MVDSRDFFCYTPSMLDKEAYQKQHTGRLVDVVTDAQKDEVAPGEHIRRVIQSAIQLQNPFIQDGDPFVVLGNDGIDSSWFPTGSFKTQEEALSHVKQKKDEEHIYSDGDEISTTFHAFTREGIHLSNPTNSSAK